MSFFKFLFGNKTPKRGAGKNFYLIDAASLLAPAAKNKNGNMPQPNPRDQAAMLRRLADFAAREKLDMAAVFACRPLREAAEGGIYREVRVYYVERHDLLAKRLLEEAKKLSRNFDVLVVTSDQNSERALDEIKIPCMKANTLRKALDERDKPMQQQHQHQQPLRKKQVFEPRPAPEQQQQQQDEDEPEAEAENSDVLKMIDPM